MSIMSIKNIPYKKGKERKEADKFIAFIREGLKETPYRLARVRTRGPRTSAARADGKCARAYDQDLPIEHAVKVTLYFDYKVKAKRINKINEEVYRLTRNIWDKQYVLRELTQKRETLKETIDELRK
jgi:hypothetical protein|tara:strand:- start:948 stop:1328 length:381 start_codon:yes stop_codon:yes gene_type:complete